MASLDNVRLFVIDALKKYHQNFLAANDIALADALSYYVSKEYANTTYLTKADAASTYITYQYANNTYVAKEAGKGLSTEDFTTAYMTKLSDIEDNAQVNIIEEVQVDGTALTVSNKAVNIDLSAYPTSAAWDSTSHKILFKHGSTYLPSLEIDGADFIKDGMIDSVSIENYSSADATTYNSYTYLYVDFNTDAEGTGHTDIKIPLGSIFNPDNFYTKQEVNALVDPLNTAYTYFTSAYTYILGTYTYFRTAYDTTETRLGALETAYAYFDSAYTYTLSAYDTTLERLDALDDAYTYLASAYTYTINSIIENEEVTAAALNDLNTRVDAINAYGYITAADISNKVDKVPGKGLSTEDFTTAYMTKLTGIESGAEVNAIETISVNGSSALAIDANRNVDITVPTKLTDLTNDGNFVQDNNYVHTDNNFTNSQVTKLSGIEPGAQVNVLEGISWNGATQTPTSKVIALSETQLSLGTAQGSGNVVSGISVSNHEITLTYTSVLTSDSQAEISIAGTAPAAETNKVAAVTYIASSGTKGHTLTLTYTNVVTTETQLSVGNNAKPESTYNTYVTYTLAGSDHTITVSYIEVVVPSYIGSLEELSQAELNTIFGISTP